MKAGYRFTMGGSDANLEAAQAAFKAQMKAEMAALDNKGDTQQAQTDKFLHTFDAEARKLQKHDFAGAGASAA